MNHIRLRADPDFFGLKENEVVIEFDKACRCDLRNRRGMVHYKRVKHTPTQTIVEHDPKRHGDPHFRRTKARMIRDVVVAAFGDAPPHPNLDDWMLDKGFF